MTYAAGRYFLSHMPTSRHIDENQVVGLGAEVVPVGSGAALCVSTGAGLAASVEAVGEPSAGADVCVCCDERGHYSSAHASRPGRGALAQRGNRRSIWIEWIHAGRAIAWQRRTAPAVRRFGQVGVPPPTSI